LSFSLFPLFHLASTEHAGGWKTCNSLYC
jgi:hypothetical protein